MYESLQFPVEIDTKGAKTVLKQLLFLFTQSMIYKYRVLINKAQFSHNYFHNIMFWLQNNFNILRDLKTGTFESCHVTYTASYAWVF